MNTGEIKENGKIRAKNCVYHLPTLKVIKNEKDLPKLVVPLVAAAILLFLLFHQYIRAGDRSS